MAPTNFDKKRLEVLLATVTEDQTDPSDDRMRSKARGLQSAENTPNSSSSSNFEAFKRTLDQAGFNPPTFIQVAALKATLAIIVIGALELFYFKAGLFALSSIPLGMMAIAASSILQINKKIKEKSLLFERDFPSFLLAISSSLKSGLDPIVAFRNTAKLFPKDSVINQELVKVNNLIADGIPELTAIKAFGSGVRYNDVNLFISAIELSQSEGASMAESLKRLAAVTRDRQSFRRGVRVSLTMQKVANLGIAGCTVLILGFQILTNFDSFIATTQHSLGSSLLVAGGTLMLGGLFLMYRVANSIKFD